MMSRMSKKFRITLFADDPCIHGLIRNMSSTDKNVFSGMERNKLTVNTAETQQDYLDLFLLSPPPPPVRYAPPVTEHVPLHSNFLCKNMARASGGCK